MRKLIQSLQFNFSSMLRRVHLLSSPKHVAALERIPLHQNQLFLHWRRKRLRNPMRSLDRSRVERALQMTQRNLVVIQQTNQVSDLSHPRKFHRWYLSRLVPQTWKEEVQLQNPRNQRKPVIRQPAQALWLALCLPQDRTIPRALLIQDQQAVLQ